MIRVPKKVSSKKLRAKNRRNQEQWRRRQGHLTWADYIAKRAADAATHKAARVEEMRRRKAARDTERAAKRAASKERQREIQKAWRAANRERHRASIRAWKNAHPEARRRHRSKDNQRRRIRLMKLQRGRCAICRERLTGETHIDHIIPRSAGGSNLRSNIQLTCAPCNMAKGARDPLVHARTLGRLL